MRCQSFSIYSLSTSMVVSCIPRFQSNISSWLIFIEFWKVERIWWYAYCCRFIPWYWCSQYSFDSSKLFLKFLFEYLYHRPQFQTKKARMRIFSQQKPNFKPLSLNLSNCTVMKLSQERSLCWLPIYQSQPKKLKFFSSNYMKHLLIMFWKILSLW